MVLSLTHKSRVSGGMLRMVVIRYLQTNKVWEASNLFIMFVILRLCQSTNGDLSPGPLRGRPKGRRFEGVHHPR